MAKSQCPPHVFFYHKNYICIFDLSMHMWIPRKEIHRIAIARMVKCGQTVRLFVVICQNNSVVERVITLSAVLSRYSHFRTR